METHHNCPELVPFHKLAMILFPEHKEEDVLVQKVNGNVYIYTYLPAGLSIENQILVGCNSGVVKLTHWTFPLKNWTPESVQRLKEAGYKASYSEFQKISKREISHPTTETLQKLSTLTIDTNSKEN